MSIHAFLLTASALAAAPVQDGGDAPYVYDPASLVEAEAPNLLAIKVGVAETGGEAGRLEHVVILVENGKIVTIGEDLPIERGIPVLDKDPEWTVTPGFVNAYSRLGLDSRAGTEFRPEGRVAPELYPANEQYDEVIEYGITTLGLYPPGSSIPGQASAVRSVGDTKSEMILNDEGYLKIVLRSNSSSKRALKNGFKKVEDYREKDDKAREKWEKSKKKKKSKKDDDEDEEKYVSITPDAQTKPFLELLAGDLEALIAITRAGDYLHFLDAMGDHEFNYAIRVPLTRESDIFYVKDQLGEAECRVVVEPSITLHPGTMRQRNLPAELSESGAKLVLIPRSDSLSSHRDWRRHIGEVIGSGLDRETALRAVTLEPAELLGVSDRLGSLEKEKDANMVFFSGDPFEVTTRIEAVMIDGEFVFSEEEL